MRRLGQDAEPDDVADHVWQGPRSRRWATARSRLDARVTHPQSRGFHARFVLAKESSTHSGSGAGGSAATLEGRRRPPFAPHVEEMEWRFAPAAPVALSID